MAVYFIGKIKRDLGNINEQYFPVGVIAREGHDAEVRVLRKQDIPIEHQPQSSLSQVVIDNLEVVFRQTIKPSTYNTTITFEQVMLLDESGTLAERANRLFDVHVLSSLPKT